MLADGETWFLLADGRKARVLVELRRGGDLKERHDWAMSIADEDLYDPQDRPPRSVDRAGAGRHAMDKGRNLHEAEEQKFLKRVAERLGDAARHNAFDHLVLAAPPRALGALREELSEAVRGRVRAEIVKDIVEEDDAQLRARLSETLRYH